MTKQTEKLLDEDAFLRANASFLRFPSNLQDLRNFIRAYEAHRTQNLSALDSDEAVEVVARAVANAKVDAYSVLRHALEASPPLIDCSASQARRRAGDICNYAAKAAIQAVKGILG